MDDQMNRPVDEKTDEPITHDDNAIGGWKVLILCLVIVGLILFYIARVGPAVWLWENMGWSYELFRYFYAPVIWLHEHTPLRESLEWWVDLFQRMAGRYRI